MAAPGSIVIGKGSLEQDLILSVANRHGLIAGATGTGKTSTLRVMAEGLSRAGVPVFVADIKSDLAGICVPGDAKGFITERAQKLGLQWSPAGSPTVFWDLFGELGHPLVLHCVHRNPSVPPHFDSAMTVKDSLVHEVDVTRFLLGEEITSIQVITPTPNSLAAEGLSDPQIAIFKTASGRHVDVELFVTTGVAYEVRTELVAERGSAFIGLDVGLVAKRAPGVWGGTITPSFKERFGQAYDTEIQCWVDAIATGAGKGDYTDGPTAWDGYAAAAVCEAGVQSLHSGLPVEVSMAARDSIQGA